MSVRRWKTLKIGYGMKIRVGPKYPYSAKAIRTMVRTQKTLEKIEKAVMPFKNLAKQKHAPKPKLAKPGNPDSLPDPLRQNYNEFRHKLFRQFRLAVLSRFLTVKGAADNPPSPREMRKFQRELTGKARKLLYREYTRSIKKLPHLIGNGRKTLRKEIAEIKSEVRKMTKELGKKTLAVEDVANRHGYTPRHVWRLLKPKTHHA